MNEQAIRRRSMQDRRKARKYFRRRAARQGRRLTTGPLSPAQKAAHKRMSKLMKRGLAKKVARFHEDVTLAATTRETVLRHNPKFISLVLEAASKIEDQADARAFAEYWLKRDPTYSLTKAGAAAVMFEAVLGEKAEELYMTLVETVVEPDEETFLAIFDGPITDEQLEELAKECEECCTPSILVRKGDISPDGDMTSDVTILECEPKKLGKDDMEKAQAMTEPKPDQLDAMGRLKVEGLSGAALRFLDSDAVVDGPVATGLGEEWEMRSDGRYYIRERAKLALGEGQYAAVQSLVPDNYYQKSESTLQSNVNAWVVERAAEGTTIRLAGMAYQCPMELEEWSSMMEDLAVTYADLPEMFEMIATQVVKEIAQECQPILPEACKQGSVMADSLSTRDYVALCVEGKARGLTEEQMGPYLTGEKGFKSRYVQESAEFDRKAATKARMFGLYRWLNIQGDKKLFRKGTLDQLNKYAETKGWKWIAEPGSLFGGHWQDQSQRAYSFDLVVNQNEKAEEQDESLEEAKQALKVAGYDLELYSKPTSTNVEYLVKENGHVRGMVSKFKDTATETNPWKAFHGTSNMQYMGATYAKDGLVKAVKAAVSGTKLEESLPIQFTNLTESQEPLDEAKQKLLTPAEIEQVIRGSVGIAHLIDGPDTKGEVVVLSKADTNKHLGKYGFKMATMYQGTDPDTGKPIRLFVHGMARVTLALKKGTGEATDHYYVVSGEHDGKPMKPVMVRAWDFDKDMMKANLGPVTNESKSFDELGDYTRVPAHKLRTGDVVFHPTLRRQVRVSWNEVQTTGEKIWLTFYTLDGKIESGNKRQMSVERGQQFVVYPDMYDASFMRDAADENAPAGMDDIDNWSAKDGKRYYKVNRTDAYQIDVDADKQFVLTLVTSKGGQFIGRLKTAKEAATRAAKHYGLQERDEPKRMAGVEFMHWLNEGLLVVRSLRPKLTELARLWQANHALLESKGMSVQAFYRAALSGQASGPLMESLKEAGVVVDSLSTAALDEGQLRKGVRVRVKDKNFHPDWVKRAGVNPAGMSGKVIQITPQWGDYVVLLDKPHKQDNGVLIRSVALPASSLEVLDEAIDYTQAKDDPAVAKKMLSLYRRRESGNDHAGNYLMLATAYGTPEQVKRVQAIKKKRDTTDQGVSFEDSQWMNKEIGPYYYKLEKDAKKQATNESRELWIDDALVVVMSTKLDTAAYDDLMDKLVDARKRGSTPELRAHAKRTMTSLMSRGKLTGTYKVSAQKVLDALGDVDESDYEVVESDPAAELCEATPSVTLAHSKGGPWKVKTEKGTVLGKHPSKRRAIRQMVAVKLAKKRRGEELEIKSRRERTVKQVESLVAEDAADTIAEQLNMARVTTYPDWFVKGGYGKFQPVKQMMRDGQNVLRVSWKRGQQYLSMVVTYNPGTDTYTVETEATDFNTGQRKTLYRAEAVYVDALVNEPETFFPSNMSKPFKPSKGTSEAGEDDSFLAVVTVPVSARGNMDVIDELLDKLVEKHGGERLVGGESRGTTFEFEDEYDAASFADAVSASKDKALRGLKVGTRNQNEAVDSLSTVTEDATIVRSGRAKVYSLNVAETLHERDLTTVVNAFQGAAGVEYAAQAQKSSGKIVVLAKHRTGIDGVVASLAKGESKLAKPLTVTVSEAGKMPFVVVLNSNMGIQELDRLDVVYEVANTPTGRTLVIAQADRNLEDLKAVVAMRLDMESVEAAVNAYCEATKIDPDEPTGVNVIERDGKFIVYSDGMDKQLDGPFDTEEEAEAAKKKIMAKWERHEEDDYDPRDPEASAKAERDGVSGVEEGKEEDFLDALKDGAKKFKHDNRGWDKLPAYVRKLIEDKKVTAHFVPAEHTTYVRLKRDGEAGGMLRDEATDEASLHAPSGHKVVFLALSHNGTWFVATATNDDPNQQLTAYASGWKRANRKDAENFAKQLSTRWGVPLKVIKWDGDYPKGEYVEESAKAHFRAFQAKHRVQPIDTEQFPAKHGLEGPFRFRNGRVLYYDPKEGKYYDSTKDMYVELSELPESESMLNDYRAVKAFDAASRQLPEGVEFTASVLTQEQLVESLKATRQPGKSDSEPLEKHYTQWLKSGNAMSPIGTVTTEQTLGRAAYRIKQTMSGVQFERVRPVTDVLYRYRSGVAEQLLAEIDAFWGLKEKYEEMGLRHARGILLYGPPGCGKSSMVQQVAEMIVEHGDIVVFAKSIGGLAEGLSALRQIEPDRKVVVVLEDMDEYVNYAERELLNLLDGDNAQEGILYVGTTNYLDRFPPRLLRSGRFDKKLLVGPPAEEARRVYFDKKLNGKVESNVIDELVKASDGMNFGDLKELVVATYVLKEPMAETVKRIRRGGRVEESSDDSLSKAIREAGDSDGWLKHPKVEQAVRAWAKMTDAERVKAMKKFGMEDEIIKDIKRLHPAAQGMNSMSHYTALATAWDNIQTFKGRKGDAFMDYLASMDEDVAEAVKVDKKSKLYQEFRKVGEQAFKAGQSRVPAMDATVMKRLKQLTGIPGQPKAIGSPDTMEILTGFLDGWDAANLANPVESVEEAQVLPKFKDWQVSAGGTQGWEGSNGYSARGEFGEYHIWPVTRIGKKSDGRYYVKFANTKGKSDQSGLWHDVGVATSPTKAYQLAVKHAQGLHEAVLEAVKKGKAMKAEFDGQRPAFTVAVKFASPADAKKAAKAFEPLSDGSVFHVETRDNFGYFTSDLGSFEGAKGEVAYTLRQAGFSIDESEMFRPDPRAYVVEVRKLEAHAHESAADEFVREFQEHVLAGGAWFEAPQPCNYTVSREEASATLEAVTSELKAAGKLPVEWSADVLEW